METPLLTKAKLIKNRLDGYANGQHKKQFTAPPVIEVELPDRSEVSFSPWLSQIDMESPYQSTYISPYQFTHVSLSATPLHKLSENLSVIKLPVPRDSDMKENYRDQNYRDCKDDSNMPAIKQPISTQENSIVKSPTTINPVITPEKDSREPCKNRPVALPIGRPSSKIKSVRNVRAAMATVRARALTNTTSKETQTCIHTQRSRAGVAEGGWKRGLMEVLLVVALGHAYVKLWAADVRGIPVVTMPKEPEVCGGRVVEVVVEEEVKQLVVVEQTPIADNINSIILESIAMDY